MEGQMKYKSCSMIKYIKTDLKNMQIHVFTQLSVGTALLTLLARHTALHHARGRTFPNRQTGRGGGEITESDGAKTRSHWRADTGYVVMGRADASVPGRLRPHFSNRMLTSRREVTAKACASSFPPRGLAFSIVAFFFLVLFWRKSSPNMSKRFKC